MKRGAFLVLLCLLFTVCSAVHAENASRYIFFINDVPQLQVKMSKAWSAQSIELKRHQFMDFDPIQEYAHRDGVHTLRVYFIPYKGAFTQPVDLELVERALSARDIETKKDQLNGASILKGVLAPSQKGYGVIVQDTQQYGFFAIIGCPQNGADLSDQDEEIQTVLRSVCDADHFAFSLSAESAGKAKNEQDDRSDEDLDHLTESAAELKALYQSLTESISALEEEISAMKASSSSQQTSISEMERDAAAVANDAEAILAQLNEAQSEIETISAYLKCGNCGYAFSWDPEFIYCPKCGTPRAVPKDEGADLTEQRYADLQSNAVLLKERYDGIAALAEKKQRELEELKAANALLEADIQKKQNKLEKEKSDAAIILKQLEDTVAALDTHGKCVNCGYVFPDDSAFNYCPKCGTRR